MKEKTYTKKDGSAGVSYHLEDGDVFKTKVNKPKVFEGQYTNYSLSAEYNGNDIFISLSEGQAKFFDKFNVDPGTELKAEKYTNNYGEFVGIRFNKAKEDTPSEGTNLLQIADNDELTLTPKEQEIYAQIEGIASRVPDQVTEPSFILTMKTACSISEERAKEIWDKKFAPQLKR